MSAMSGDDLRGEARQIASSLRALLEQLQETGADAIPSEPVARRAAPALPHAQSPQQPQHAQHAPHAPHAQVERGHAPPARPVPSADREPSRPAAPRGDPFPRAEAPIAARPAPAAHVALPVFHTPEVTLDEPAERAAGLERLEALKRIVAACRGCALHASRTQTVFSRGNPETDLMFVGEGPGANEDATGLPFVGEAGQLLDRMITAMGYAPEQVYIANVVKCRPPSNRKPEPLEMETCEGYLHEQIAIVRPRAIVALGATACEGLLKLSGITRLRGSWRLYRGSIPVMPTFHPAYLLRTPSAKRDVWSDLQQVMLKLGKPPPGKGA
jgi:DNA polymerase